METIKQEGQQLLGVLLLEAVEPRRVLCYRPLRSHRKRETFNKGDGEREIVVDLDYSWNVLERK